MRPGKTPPALEEFVSAVHAFSDDPSKRNLARYLEASRKLECLKQAKVSARTARARSKPVAQTLQASPT
jgi:hypothetical protein